MTPIIGLKWFDSALPFYMQATCLPARVTDFYQLLQSLHHQLQDTYGVCLTISESAESVFGYMFLLQECIDMHICRISIRYSLTLNVFFFE